MCLVNDDQVELQSELSGFGQSLPASKALDGADVRGPLRNASTFQASLQINESGACQLCELESEALLHLPLPLANEGRRAHHQDPVRLTASLELGPQQARLDGLAESHLVRHEHPKLPGADQLHDGLELVRPEDGPGCPI